MSGITGWLRNNASSFQPTASVALNATRHMSQIERKKLFSLDIEHMRTAEGRWYEAIMYETFRDLSLETDTIHRVALKGADAPRGRRNFRLGQNGFFYSRLGDITIRGNGQDLAEFDLLFFDADGNVAFAEVVTSASDMKEFEKEIEYKKKLLGYLFNQKVVPFLLISSFDVRNYSVGKRLLKCRDNVNIRTIPCEEIKSLIKPGKTQKSGNNHSNNPKLFRASDLLLKRRFEYQKYHDWERDRVFKSVSNKIDVRESENNDETSRLVKKILYGSLYPSGVRTLCKDRDLTFKGTRLDIDDIFQKFSKVVLATDLPDYEPLIYLRSRQKQQYLKMVQGKDGNFKFERYTPSRVGFFLWLESLNPTLGARITTQILDAFSPSEN